MRTAQASYYVIVRMHTPIQIPDDATHDDARRILVEASSDPQPQWIMDAIRTMNAAAEAIDGVVDWSDEDGIEIGNDHLFDQET